MEWKMVGRMPLHEARMMETDFPEWNIPTLDDVMSTDFIPEDIIAEGDFWVENGCGNYEGFDPVLGTTIKTHPLFQLNTLLVKKG